MSQHKISTGLNIVASYKTCCSRGLISHILFWYVENNCCYSCRFITPLVTMSFDFCKEPDGFSILQIIFYSRYILVYEYKLKPLSILWVLPDLSSRQSSVCMFLCSTEMLKTFIIQNCFLIPKSIVLFPTSGTIITLRGDASLKKVA